MLCATWTWQAGLLVRTVFHPAVASVTSLAHEAGYSPVTLDTYRNRRPPSVAAARAVADAMETRAVRLLENAERLREAADDEARRGGPHPTARPLRRRPDFHNPAPLRTGRTQARVPTGSPKRSDLP